MPTDPVDQPIRSILGVFAHPDDESLAAGGLLARCAASGVRTEVVTATWASGTTRAVELSDAVRILGAGEPRLLGLADLRVPESAPQSPRLVDAPLDDVVRRLVAHLREARPDVVVTHDAHGGLTGHPDHLHTHRVTVLAVEAARLGSLYPETGAAWQPRELWFATHPHSALPMLREVVGTRRAVHTVPDADVTQAVDVAPWLDQKVSAILAHRHEVERGGLPGVVAGLRPDDRLRLLSTEWYSIRTLRATESAGEC